MTDNEIKKALECCVGDNDGKNCFDCPLWEIDGCQERLLLDALDLINRLQAKNQMLTTAHPKTIESIKKMRDKAKAEAYKECIEKVKTEIDEALKNNYKVRSERAQAIPIYTEDEFWNYCAGKIDCLRGLDDFCDNLLKEMVGENNETKTF